MFFFFKKKSRNKKTREEPSLLSWAMTKESQFMSLFFHSASNAGEAAAADGGARGRGNITKESLMEQIRSLRNNPAQMAASREVKN